MLAWGGPSICGCCSGCLTTALLCHHRSLAASGIPGLSSIQVPEGSMAYASCPGGIIAAIVDPVFGDAWRSCNASDSYA